MVNCSDRGDVDHCRIGSLEIYYYYYYYICDHCRIGSLEIRYKKSSEWMDDHCRIGSLENDAIFTRFFWR